MDENRELLKLELEGLPPTVNHMYMHTRTRHFCTKECRDYQDYVLGEIMRLRLSKELFTGRAALNIKFTASNRRRWDIDNRVKALQDCLTMAGVIKDDSQVDKLTLERVYGKHDSTVLILSNLDA